MRSMKHGVAVAAVCGLIAVAMPALSQKAKPATKPAAPKQTKFGALAVDRSKAFVFAWSYDQPSRAAANQFVLDECAKRDGNCAVVVEFAGEGCASYHTISAENGDAYGWGTGPTQAASEARSQQECNAFADGKATCSNHVWACNSKDVAPFKVLREEPVKPKPGKTDCLVQFDIDEEANGSDDWVNRYRSPVYRLAANDCPSAPAERYHSYTWDTREAGGKGSEYEPVDKDPKRLQRGISMVQGFYEWVAQRPAPGGDTHFRPYANVYVTAAKEDLQADLTGDVGQSDSDRQHGICVAYAPPGVVPVATYGAERCRSWLR
jgi:hypothetical protein